MLELKHAWRGGTRHLLVAPVEFLEKLAALTPRPEITLVLYHGVLARHVRWRPEVVAYRRAESDEATGPSAAAGRAGPGGWGGERPRYWTWATLMRRAFDLDVLRCPRCAGGCSSLPRSTIRPSSSGSSPISDSRVRETAHRSRPPCLRRELSSGHSPT